MGKVSRNKIIVIVCVFLLSALMIYIKPQANDIIKKNTLKSSLIKVDGWGNKGHMPFDNNIVDALLLDDYLNMSFSDGRFNLSLYIGYYFSSKKVGAAHDPMVCFPGQGWTISDQTTSTVELKSGDTISYSMMTGQLGSQKQLILYWFQSYDETNADTFSQKLSLLKKKIFRQGEDNAFVRITIPIDIISPSEGHENIIRFIHDFYPVFLKYVTDN